jgi:hypothetical protein
MERGREGRKERKS